MGSGEAGWSCNLYIVQGSRVNREYQIGKTWRMGRMLRLKDETVPKEALKGIHYVCIAFSHIVSQQRI
jgi:hypothetical protein